MASVNRLHQPWRVNNYKHPLLNTKTASIFSGSDLCARLLFNIAVCFITANLAACQTNKTVPPPLPAEVVILIDRATQCLHFAGEINGDQRARDRDVMGLMQRLQCESIATELNQASLQHQNNPDIYHALIQASKPFIDTPN